MRDFIHMKIDVIEPGGIRPKKSTPGSSCLDCHARIEKPMYVDGRETIPLGFKVEVPRGYVLLIAPRSGLSRRGHDTSVGHVDEDYRGEVAATIDGKLLVNPGDRIAQMRLVANPAIVLVDAHIDDDTERGAGGFGSTGISA